MSWKTLKHPGSRRIKKALFVLHQILLQDQAQTALEESVLRSSFIILPRSSPDGPLDQQTSNSRLSPDGP
ncbi:hypothetical protein PS2_004581 [Malus domestica]